MGIIFSFFSPTTPLRRLGRDGPLVSPIGFGAMGLSTSYGSVPSDEERMAVLDAAVAQGVNLIDSANVYGDNEVLLAKWFKERPGMREKVLVCTKFGIYTKDGVTVVPRGDKEYVRECIEKSLQNFDVIDLLYVHWIDPKTPIEETVGVMAEYVKAGKVEYSLFSLDIETKEVGILKTARELGVAIVPFSPLGRGMLSGRYRSPDDFEETDYRKLTPRFSRENFPKNLALVEKIAEIAARKGCTTSQIALAWILAQGDDFIPIPGSKNVKYVQENCAAAMVQLTPEEVQLIRQYAQDSQGKGGERMPEFMKAVSFGDSAPLNDRSI